MSRRRNRLSGTAAVEERGANVTAVCGADHVELVRSLGADRVVDYMTGAFTRTTSVTTWSSIRVARAPSASANGF